MKKMILLGAAALAAILVFATGMTTVSADDPEGKTTKIVKTDNTVLPCRAAGVGCAAAAEGVCPRLQDEAATCPHGKNCAQCEECPVKACDGKGNCSECPNAAECAAGANCKTCPQAGVCPQTAGQHHCARAAALQSNDASGEARSATKAVRRGCCRGGRGFCVK